MRRRTEEARGTANLTTYVPAVDNPTQPTRRSEMPNAAYDKDHRDERANWQALIDSGHPVNCRRCHRPIRPGQSWDLGHHNDLILGGNKKARSPEHANCNRSAGATLATQTPPSRNW